MESAAAFGVGFTEELIFRGMACWEELNLLLGQMGDPGCRRLLQPGAHTLQPDLPPAELDARRCWEDCFLLGLLAPFGDHGVPLGGDRAAWRSRRRLVPAQPGSCRPQRHRSCLAGGSRRTAKSTPIGSCLFNLGILVGPLRLMAVGVSPK